MLADEIRRCTGAILPMLPTADDVMKLINRTVGPMRFVKLPDQISRTESSVLSPMHGVALQSLGANHVLVIFEEEGLALFLYRNEADQHHVVRQMISRQFKEKPFRVCYCDVQMRIPMTTPEIVCLTSISSDKFTMGDFDDRWSEMTLKQMMSFRRSNALV